MEGIKEISRHTLQKFDNFERKLEKAIKRAEDVNAVPAPENGLKQEKAIKDLLKEVQTFFNKGGWSLSEVHKMFDHV
ncbi:MAG: hypothetical protein ABH888_03540 [Patescibacteria group bacterium]|nr:hypothetical protein [Patescibacteria group bacterium]MBU1871070.1 hypothetical protein [Patescibacteria group bacterium]